MSGASANADQNGMSGKKKSKRAHKQSASAGSSGGSSAMSGGRHGKSAGGQDSEAATTRQLNEQELNRARQGG